MDDLRLSLLAIGIVVLIAVYALTLRTVRRRERRQFRLGGDGTATDPGHILHDYVNELPTRARRERREPGFDPRFDPRNPDNLDMSAPLPELEPVGEVYADEYAEVDDPGLMNGEDDYRDREYAEQDYLEEEYLDEEDLDDEYEDDDYEDDDYEERDSTDQQDLTEDDRIPVLEAVDDEPALAAEGGDAHRAVADGNPPADEEVIGTAASADEETPVPEMLVIFFLMIRGEPMSGRRIEQAAVSVGMEQSPRGTYDLYLTDDDGHRRQLLGLANALEPGVFDFSNPDSFATPGLVLYMQLPGPLSGLEAFDDMLEIANSLSSLLDAEVLDDTRKVLTNRAVAQWRDRIRDHELRMQLLVQRHDHGLSPTL